MRPPFIVTTPIRDEAWILEKFLATTSLWADQILILDSGCEDTSLKICQNFPKVQILPFNPRYLLSEYERRLDLFYAARRINSNAIVFVFDVDEILSAEILSPLIQAQLIEKLQAPGNALSIPWIMLWKNSLEYRTEANGIWSNRSINCIYWDDGQSEYPLERFVHIPRAPRSFRAQKIIFNLPLLHYQFTTWERTRYKQAYYRMIEWEKSKRTWINSLAINTLYATTRESHGAETQSIPECWISEYLNAGIDLRYVNEDPLPWFAKSAIKQFIQNGLKYYSSIDIWDLPWSHFNFKLQEIDPAIPTLCWKDPRNILQKISHFLIQFAGRYGTRIALCFYRLLKYAKERFKRNSTH